MKITDESYKRIIKAEQGLDEVISKIIVFLGETNTTLSKYNYDVFNRFANIQRHILVEAITSLTTLFRGDDGIRARIEDVPKTMTGHSDSKLTNRLEDFDKTLDKLQNRAECIPLITTETSNPYIPQKDDTLYEDLYLKFKCADFYGVSNRMDEFMISKYYYEDDLIGDLITHFQKIISQAILSLIVKMNNEFEALGDEIQAIQNFIKNKTIHLSDELLNKPLNDTNNQSTQLPVSKESDNSSKECTPIFKKKQKKPYEQKWNDDETIKQIITSVKECGKRKNISTEEAKEMFNCIRDFCGTEFSLIRDAYINPDTTKAKETYNRKLQKIDEYIKIVSKWDGGTIYRGIGVSKEEAKKIVSGESLDMKGPASWSTKEDIAREFALKKGVNAVSLVFVLKNNISGVSIRHISQLVCDEEVLSPSRVLYDVDSYETKNIDGNDYLFVHVHERPEG